MSLWSFGLPASGVQARRGTGEPDMLALCRRSLQSKMLLKQGQGSPAANVDVPQTFQTFRAPVTRKRSKAEKEAENVEKAGVAAWLNFNFYSY